MSERYVQPGDLVLFQGDSITDCGRDRSNGADMGSGYALMASAQFSYRHAADNVRFLNRGIGGDTTDDLRARWQRDALDLQPDVLSLMIGINDVWRSYDSLRLTSAARIVDNLRYLLGSAAGAGISRLVMLEPFFLQVPGMVDMRSGLLPVLEVVRMVAAEFAARLVPLDRLFTEALRRQEAAYWLHDGVHPTPAGHALIANAWLAAVGPDA